MSLLADCNLVSPGLECCCDRTNNLTKGDTIMMLRFRYGNVNDKYEYQDNQLHAIDSYLDEDQIRQRFADTYRSHQTCMGRTPLDPVIAYKAHLLYFLKRDIISFNELPEQINAKADYRAFCRSDGVAFTPGYLSVFRKYHLIPFP